MSEHSPSPLAGKAGDGERQHSQSAQQHLYPSARLTASAGVSTDSSPFTDQLSSATTGRPSLRATAISLSVPQPSPMAITLSAAVTIRTLRAWPMPVGREIVRFGLEPARSVSGRMPTTVPPASAAPSLAAPETPPSPPLMTTTPASASSLPTSRADASCDAVASEAPHTATYLRGIGHESSGACGLVHSASKFNARGAKEVRRNLG